MALVRLTLGCRSSIGLWARTLGNTHGAMRCQHIAHQSSYSLARIQPMFACAVSIARFHTASSFRGKDSHSSQEPRWGYSFDDEGEQDRDNETTVATAALEEGAVSGAGPLLKEIQSEDAQWEIEVEMEGDSDGEGDSVDGSCDRDDTYVDDQDEEPDFDQAGLSSVDDNDDEDSNEAPLGRGKFVYVRPKSKTWDIIEDKEPLPTFTHISELVGHPSIRVFLGRPSPSTAQSAAALVSLSQQQENSREELGSYIDDDAQEEAVAEELYHDDDDDDDDDDDAIFKGMFMSIEDVVRSLERLSADNITVMEVCDSRRDHAEFVTVVSAKSRRHMRAIAEDLAKTLQSQSAGLSEARIEGAHDDYWTLVHLGNVVVHVMMPAAREYYNLEELWTPSTVPSALEQ
eukprot:m.24342 g.24342  ORF g.24342 m.24342 type:complete len:402 (-) comp8588_c0_seq3:4576-5781(-)